MARNDLSVTTTDGRLAFQLHGGVLVRGTSVPVEIVVIGTSRMDAIQRVRKLGLRSIKVREAGDVDRSGVLAAVDSQEGVVWREWMPPNHHWSPGFTLPR